MNQSGFTLLEVLLALAVYTIIGIATIRNVTQIQNTKNAAFEDIDLYSDVRSGLSLMRSDLSQAFHVLYDDLGAENKSAVQQGASAPHTVFDGRKAEMVFTSLSHRVYYTGKHESEQTEISFFLQRREGKKLPSLMKRESEFIDSDLYAGGSIYRLIDGVESLEFQYWDDKQKKWVDDWNSDGTANRDRFPMAVKVKITVAKGDRQKLQAETQFKVAFPNNDQFVVQF